MEPLLLILAVAGSVFGFGAGWIMRGRQANNSKPPTPSPDRTDIRRRDVGRLMGPLSEMQAALQAVQPAQLQARGGWDQELFDAVLGHVQEQTPLFQAALTTYLAQPIPHDDALVIALLAVDRLSAAYTYWTRLFPPGKQQESMFVLSLLHDLGARVEHAMKLLEAAA